jgi:hypothetical protein
MDNKKGKKIKVTVTDLNTGKKTSSYFEAGKTIKDTVLPENLRLILETKTMLKSFYNSPLVDSIRTVNQNKIYTSPAFEMANKIAYPTNSIMENIVSPAFEAISPIVDIAKKFNDIQPVFLNSFTQNSIYESFLRLQESSIIQTIQDIWRNASRWEKIKKQLKSQNKSIPNGQARKIKQANSELKASNRILGYVCFFAGYYTNEQINNFLQKVNLMPSPNTIKELGRFRQSIQKRVKNFNNLVFDISDREINIYYNCVQSSIKILKEFKLKGKVLATQQLKTIEKLRAQR